MKPFTSPTGRTMALLATAALTGAMLTAPQAAAATTTPGLATCINQVAASGHADLLAGSPNYWIGTTGNDDPGSGTTWTFVPGDGPATIYCGLAGADWSDDIFPDDYFFGGPGNDGGGAENFSLYVGGAGDDNCEEAGYYDGHPARFEGGPGNDTSSRVAGVFDGGLGNDTAAWLTGTFYGGPGDDKAVNVANWFGWSAGSGTFVGGMGNDSVDLNDAAGVVYGNVGNDSVDTNKGRFDGGGGNDTVKVNYGTFIGGPGYDTVLENHGTCQGVEAGC